MCTKKTCFHIGRLFIFSSVGIVVQHDRRQFCADPDPVLFPVEFLFLHILGIDLVFNFFLRL
jgi:hypothetical protein